MALYRIGRSVSICWQVSDAPLYSLSMDVQGRMLGVGSQNGVVTLIRPSDSLVELQRQEKSVINSVSSPRNCQLLEQNSAVGVVFHFESN